MRVSLCFCVLLVAPRCIRASLRGAFTLPSLFAGKVSAPKHSKIAIIVDGSNLHKVLEKCDPPLKEKDIDWWRFFTYIASECGKGELGEVFWFHAAELRVTPVTGKGFHANQKREWIKEQEKTFYTPHEIIKKHMKKFKGIELVPAGYVTIYPDEGSSKKEKAVDMAIAMKMIRLTEPHKSKGGSYKKRKQVRYKKIMLVSGDGDFCPVIDYIKERWEVKIGVVDFSFNLADGLKKKADYPPVKISKREDIKGVKCVHDFYWRERKGPTRL